MKLGGWVVMLSTMIIFLTLMGFQTGLSNILTSIGVNIVPSSSTFTADIENSSFWDYIFGTAGIFASVLVTGVIIIGLFAKGYDVSLVILPAVVFIGSTFTSTFWGIIKYVATFNQWWMTSLVGLIFGALALGFIIACMDYFAGR